MCHPRNSVDRRPSLTIIHAWWSPLVESPGRLVNLGPFGSGQHPTTALMLKAMQDSEVPRVTGRC